MKIAKKLLATLILAVSFCFMVMTLQALSGVTFPTLFGYGYAQVKSGSMEPAIHVGEYVFVDTNASYATGDVIMYLDSSRRLITHRLVDIAADTFTTKGDANEIADPPVLREQIVGKIIFHASSPLDTYVIDPTIRTVVKLFLLITAAWILRWAICTLFESRK